MREIFGVEANAPCDELPRVVGDFATVGAGLVADAPLAGFVDGVTAVDVVDRAVVRDELLVVPSVGASDRRCDPELHAEEATRQSPPTSAPRQNFVVIILRTLKHTPSDREGAG
jgi:hypothetical protein